MNNLSDILPDRDFSLNDAAQDRETAIQSATEALEQKKTAQELARLKLREKRKLTQDEEKLRQLESEGLGNVPGHTLAQKRRTLKAQIDTREKDLAALEMVEAESKGVLTAELRRNMPYSINAERAMALQGATSAEVNNLLKSLNINLNMQLTKKDTTNLLACLLTCNESQLDALYKNKKIPIVIKTIIKRLREDADKGALSTIELIWDKVFGKMAPDQPTPTPPVGVNPALPLIGGAIPDVPLSREAYILIRDKIINS